jgi:hypothetical protein
MDRGKTFSAAMVRAIIAGTKTQTRRLATPAARRIAGALGDRIYVREHWRTIAKHDGLSPNQISELYRTAVSGPAVLYMADDARNRWFPTEQHVPAWLPGKMRQAMHMPRWASRLTLNIQEVRVERLHDIAGKDPQHEGVERVGGVGWRDYTGRFPHTLSAFESYVTLWDSLHDAVGTRWRDNPEVIVTTFTVEHGQIDGNDGLVLRSGA